MTNRRGNYRVNEKSVKTPYLLIMIILILLYIISKIYDDNKSLHSDKEMLEYEIMESDSIKDVLETKNYQLVKKLDSIKNTKPIVKPIYKRRRETPVETPAIKTPTIEKADTTN